MTDLKKRVSRRALLPHRGRRPVVTLIFDWAAKREAQRTIAARKLARLQKEKS